MTRAETEQRPDLESELGAQEDMDSETQQQQQQRNRASFLVRSLARLGVGSGTRLAVELLGLSLRLSYALIVASLRLVFTPSDKSLLGETVLITEAGRGIGRELALRLAALGCVVVCWDADAQANRATLSAISTDGGEAHGFAVNLSNRKEIEKAVQSMRKAGISDVSILINNATTPIHRPFLDYEEAELRQIFEIEVLSHFWTIQAFLPWMLDNQRGHIVCLSNACGSDALADKVPYYAAKAAVRGLMKGLGEELRLKTSGVKISLTTIYPFCTENADATKNSGRRFSSIFGATSVESASKGVIRAIQKNYDECSIPRCLIYMNTFNRVLPNRAARFITDFLYGAETRGCILA